MSPVIFTGLFNVIELTGNDEKFCCGNFYLNKGESNNERYKTLQN